MMAKRELTQAVVACAKEFDADLVAIGSADRFDGTNVFDIYPDVKSVICIAYRVLRGSHRGIEEGTTYYQYSTTGIETIEETLMPQTLLRVSSFLEEEGFLAIPQKRHQVIHPDPEGTNPEINYEEIYRGVKAEKMLDFEDCAVRCGLGERALTGNVLTKEFGPLQRYAFILTNAELEPTPLKKHGLCDGCKKCIAACPGHALSEDGRRNDWQCAVYYKGANRSKNPFMPADAFPDVPNREAVMNGTARFHNLEDSEHVLDETFFYPPIKHAYVSSVCGRACDMACYVHLEQQGKLLCTFRRPYRTRPEWVLDDKD